MAVNSADVAVETILLRNWIVKPGSENPATAVLTGDSAEGLKVVSTLTCYGGIGLRFRDSRGPPRTLVSRALLPMSRSTLPFLPPRRLKTVESLCHTKVQVCAPSVFRLFISVFTPFFIYILAASPRDICSWKQINKNTQFSLATYPSCTMSFLTFIFPPGMCVVVIYECVYCYMMLQLLSLALRPWLIRRILFLCPLLSNPDVCSDNLA